jgi:uncharacterized protein YgbK (DUF1537 family)
MGRMIAAVLADDTTGALEVGALLAADGRDALVVLDGDPCAIAAGAVILDTRTRHAPAEEAARTVRAAAQRMSEAGAAWFYKKTDSTLRGPIAAELRALTRLFPALPLVYVPAYPRLGRGVRDGVLRVDGVPVAETSFARDPRWPVTESSVLALLEGQVAPVRDAAELAERLRQGAGGRILVCDGESEADLAAIAGALHAWGGPFLAAGPAGFAAYWRRNLPGERHAVNPLPRPARWLLVCGSLHPVSRRQAERAQELGVEVLSTPRTMENSETALVDLAAQAIAAIEHGRASGLIVFGGDAARAIFTMLGGRLLRPLGEVAPGVPFSLLERPGGALPVITKAGGFDTGTWIDCILEQRSLPA